ncbi:MULTISPECIES: DUF4265 domain-containing protein [unclassified Streptomyces]|uniref:DUF4265 domain-containing protein n=1 Tax=unclassified Streptomyces TaxID=2593676 RepID=UPI000B804A32|nr:MULTISPECIES: DUF4265 domain-containing protein [unclassified Streptomyces]MYZ34511.1 DUF4265 domain-containing protein [Streptomyces sp. SID4917]
MPENEANDRVRVLFPLEQDDGWPPVASERLWAIPVDVDLVRIDNVPWFVRDLSLNDIVRTRTDPRGALEAVRKISWSGNCTVRIIPYEPGRFSGDSQAIIDIFSPLGVQAEGIEQFGMIALNVPPSADISGVKGLLIRGSEADWWDYEESCIGKAWTTSNPR